MKHGHFLSWCVVLSTVALLVAALPVQGQAVSDLLDQADDLKNQQKWNEALAVLNQAVDRQAEDEAAAALAQVRIGDYRLSMAMLDKAEEAYEKVEADFPDQIEFVIWARLGMVDIYNFTSRSQEAENAAQSIAQDNNAIPLQQAWARVKWANLLRTQARLDEAEQVLAQFPLLTLPVEERGVRLQGSLTHAEILLERGKLLDAIPVLEGIVTDAATQYPSERNWARVKLLQALTGAGLSAEAIEVAKALIEDGDSGQATIEQVARAWFYRLRARRADDLAYSEYGTIVPQVSEQAAKSGYQELAIDLICELGKAYLDDGDHAQAAAIWSEAITQAGEKYPEKRNWARVRWVQSLNSSTDQALISQIWTALAQDGVSGHATADAVAWGSLFYAEHLISIDNFSGAVEVLNGSSVYDIGDMQLDSYSDNLHLRAAKDLANAGMTDRAIAWLRAGVEDPSVLRPSDEKLVEQLGFYLNESQAEAWQEFLLDPALNLDPLASFVTGEFGSDVLGTPSLNVSNAFFRRLWVAKCHARERRWKEAESMFKQAEMIAQTTREAGEALTGLAETARHLHGMEASLLLADEAAAQWELLVQSASHPGEAHYAIDMAAGAYTICGFPDDATAALERILADVDATGKEPITAAFARYRLMIHYMSRKQPNAAAVIGQDLLNRYQDLSIGVGDEWLMQHSMLNLAYSEADLGDSVSANSRLDEIAQRWPDKAGAYLQNHRNAISVRAARVSPSP